MVAKKKTAKKVVKKAAAKKVIKAKRPAAKRAVKKVIKKPAAKRVAKKAVVKKTVKAKKPAAKSIIKSSNPTGSRHKRGLKLKNKIQTAEGWKRNMLKIRGKKSPR